MKYKINSTGQGRKRKATDPLRVLPWSSSMKYFMCLGQGRTYYFDIISSMIYQWKVNLTSMLYGHMLHLKSYLLSTLFGNLFFFLMFITPAETKIDLIAWRIIFLLLLIISNNDKRNSCTITYVCESIYLKIFILYKWQYSVKAEL